MMSGKCLAMELVYPVDFSTFGLFGIWKMEDNLCNFNFLDILHNSNYYPVQDPISMVDFVSSHAFSALALLRSHDCSIAITTFIIPLSNPFMKRQEYRPVPAGDISFLVKHHIE